jgi:chromosome segregation ATPase
MKTLSHPHEHRSLWLLAGIVALGLPTAPASAQDGLKQTEAVVKKGEDTIKAITDGRQQLEKTLASYNSIIDGKAVDPKAAYKDLGGEVKDCDSKVADVQKRRDAMNLEADKLFASWKESLAGISSEDLKKRSEARMAQTRERLAKVGDAGQVARSEYETFIKSLKDQITYLGHDLNPSAIASLKGDAAKLNQQAQKMFQKIDTTTSAANSSIDELRKP